jgi:hypothetical protein
MAASERIGESRSSKERPWLVPGLVVLLLVLSNVPLLCLVILWPEKTDMAGPTPLLPGGPWDISPEHRIMLCVAFCGLLGGSIHMLLRFREKFTDAGSRDTGPMDLQDLPWYFLTPPIGAILAVGFYLVVRGGFLASGTSVEDINVFAFGGTGVLVGMFAELAVTRLETALKTTFGGSGD